MPMETGAGLMRRNISLQAGSGLQPVVEVMAGRAGALLIEVICVIANFLVAGLGTSGGAGGSIFHKAANFRFKENYPSVSLSLRAIIGSIGAAGNGVLPGAERHFPKTWSAAHGLRRK